MQKSSSATSIHSDSDYEIVDNLDATSRSKTPQTIEDTKAQDVVQDRLVSLDITTMTPLHDEKNLGSEATNQKNYTANPDEIDCFSKCLYRVLNCFDRSK